MHRSIRAAALVSILVVLVIAFVSSADAARAGERNELRGVVVSEEGRPVEGAKVFMAKRSGAVIVFDPKYGLYSWGRDDKFLFFFTKRNGHVDVKAVTDAEGRFALENFEDPGEPYALVAMHSGSDTGALYERIVPEDHAHEPLRVVLEPAARIETGTSQTEWGADTYVSVVAPGNVRVRVARPENDGEDAADELLRSIPLPPGLAVKVVRYALKAGVAYTPHLFSYDYELQPGETVRVPSEPPPGARVEGRITAADGRGLDNVNVRLTTDDPSALSMVGALTDAEGRYVLEGVPPGTHHVELVRHAPRTAPG